MNINKQLESSVVEDKKELNKEIEAIKKLLKTKKDGTVKQSIKNGTIALANDPYLKGAIKKNELSGRIDIVKNTNWKRYTNAFTDTDMNYILLHLEENYELFNEKKILKALDVVSDNNRYHPVRDKLNNLKWDGKERLRDLLPRYLGTERSEYVYEATRILMMGAICRVFSPGCKFEYMVCFVGGQGAGKSSFIRLLSMKNEWFSDDLRKIDDSKVFEKIHGHWIIEMAEMLATCTAKTIEEIKLFLSKQMDNYRTPYDKFSEDRLRQCIFVGTSNNPYFLPFDRSGNRRFIPIEVDDKKAEHHPLEDEEETRYFMEQCWAEAMEMYRNGDNRLVFNEKLIDTLIEMQRRFMPEDSVLGMIDAYLESYSEDVICTKQIYKYALNRTDEPSRADLLEVGKVLHNNFKDKWIQTEKKVSGGEFRGQKAWFRVNPNPDGFKPIKDDKEVPFEQMKLQDLSKESVDENCGRTKE